MMSDEVHVRIATVATEFMRVMVTFANLVDKPTTDDRHGAILIKFQEDILRLAQAARLDLAALDAGGAAVTRPGAAL